MDNPDNRTWCPSAPADRPEAVVLGVHAGPGGLSYLTTPVPAAEAVEQVPEGIEPTDILRFAAHCTRSCGHHTGTGCGLVTKVVLAAPTTADPLPRCHLRGHCQWWRQSGRAACERCPLVRTTAPEAEADELTRQVADPALGPDDLSLPANL
jgi:hypothetical protein